MVKTLILGMKKLKSVGINLWDLLWLSISYVIKIGGYYLLSKLELKKLSNLCVIVCVTMASLLVYLSDVFCKLKKKDLSGYKIFYRLLKKEESKVFVLSLKVCIYLLAVVVTLEYFVVVLDYFIIKFGGKVGDIYNFELRENLKGKYLGVDSLLGDTDVALFYYSQVKIIKLAVSYFLKVNYVLLCNGVLLCFLGYLILIYSMLFGMNLYLQGLFSCLIGLWILTGVLNNNYSILNLLILNLVAVLGSFGIDKDFIENWYVCKDYKGSIPVNYTYVIGLDYIVEHLNNDEDFFSYDEADRIYEKDDMQEIYSGPEMAEAESKEWDFVVSTERSLFERLKLPGYNLSIKSKWDELSEIYESSRLSKWYNRRGFTSELVNLEYDSEYYEENLDWIDLYEEDPDEYLEGEGSDFLNTAGDDRELLVRKYILNQKVLSWSSSKFNIPSNKGGNLNYLDYYYKAVKVPDVTKVLSKYNLFLYEMLESLPGENSETSKSISKIEWSEQSYLGFFNVVKGNEVDGYVGSLLKYLIFDYRKSFLLGGYLLNRDDFRLLGNLRSLLFKYNNELKNLYQDRILINKIDYTDLRLYELYLSELGSFKNESWSRSGVHWLNYLKGKNLEEEEYRSNILGEKGGRDIIYGGGEHRLVGHENKNWLGESLYEDKRLIRNLKGFYGLDSRKVLYPMISLEEMRSFKKGLLYGLRSIDDLGILDEKLKLSKKELNLRELDYYDYLSERYLVVENLCDYIVNYNIWNMSDRYLKFMINTFFMKEVYEWRNSKVISKLGIGNDLPSVMKKLEENFYSVVGASILGGQSMVLNLTAENSIVKFQDSLDEILIDEDEDFDESGEFYDEAEDFMDDLFFVERGSGVVFDLIKNESTVRDAYGILSCADPYAHRSYYDWMDTVFEEEDWVELESSRRYIPSVKRHNMSKIFKLSQGSVSYLLSAIYSQDGWVETLWGKEENDFSRGLEIVFSKDAWDFDWIIDPDLLSDIYKNVNLSNGLELNFLPDFMSWFSGTIKNRYSDFYGSSKLLGDLVRPFGNLQDVNNSDDFVNYLNERFFDENLVAVGRSGILKGEILKEGNIVDCLTVDLEGEKVDNYLSSLLHKRLFYSRKNLFLNRDGIFIEDDFSEYLDEALYVDRKLRKEEFGPSYWEAIAFEENINYINLLEVNGMDMIKDLNYETDSIRESFTDDGENASFGYREEQVAMDDYLFSEIRTPLTPLISSNFVNFEGVLVKEPLRRYDLRKKFLWGDGDLDYLKKINVTLFESTAMRDFYSRRKYVYGKVPKSDESFVLKYPYDLLVLRGLRTKSWIGDDDEDIVEYIDILEWRANERKYTGKCEGLDLKYYWSKDTDRFYFLDWYSTLKNIDVLNRPKNYKRLKEYNIMSLLDYLGSWEELIKLWLQDNMFKEKNIFRRVNIFDIFYLGFSDLILKQLEVSKWVGREGSKLFGILRENSYNRERIDSYFNRKLSVLAYNDKVDLSVKELSVKDLSVQDELWSSALKLEKFSEIDKKGLVVLSKEKKEKIYDYILSRRNIEGDYSRFLFAGKDLRVEELDLIHKNYLESRKLKLNLSKFNSSKENSLIDYLNKVNELKWDLNKWCDVVGVDLTVEELLILKDKVSNLSLELSKIKILEKVKKEEELRINNIKLFKRNKLKLNILDLDLSKDLRDVDSDYIKYIY